MSTSLVFAVSVTNWPRATYLNHLLSLPQLFSAGMT